MKNKEIKDKDVKNIQIRNSTVEFLTFTKQNNENNINVVVEDETIWLSQKLMSELFDCTTNNIVLHLKNIYEEKELDEDSTSKFFLQVQKEGSRNVERNTKLYNLDAILSVGYRINSKKATQFRQWATRILKEYTIKGFALDDERLKNGAFFTKDYFQELLEKIREIRASERKFYQKITDIYSTAMDYNKDDEITKKFFASVQNKLHFAIHNHTASELIMERANAEKPYMGLTSWKNSPDGKILESDVVIAKNYLTEKEITTIDRLTSAYLDYAEDQAENNIPMTMKDWSDKLNKFLILFEKPILDNAGTIKQIDAELKAKTEFQKYRVIQDRIFESDFDREIKKINKKGK